MKKLIFSLLFLHFLFPNQNVFGQPLINIQSCQGSQTPASNLVCFGNFENINQAQWNEFSDFEISDPTAGWQATGMIQTPDLLFGFNFGSIFGGFNLSSDPSLVCGLNKGIVQNPTGHFAHIVDDKKNTLREGFALPLKNALVEGKIYQLSFDFYTGCDNQLNILLANNRPCNHTVNSFNVFPDDNTIPLQKVDCGGVRVFRPAQTIFETVKGNAQWQSYTTTITVPKGEDPIEYIIFYAHFNSNVDNSFHKSTSTYFDNIKITENPGYSACLTDLPDPAVDLVWGYPNTTTYYSTLKINPKSNWKTVTVYGQLVIDEDVSFTDKTFYMEEGSELVINGSKVDFKTCVLQGCKKMWKGIKLENSGALNFIENLVEDAQWGIRSSGTNMFLNNNTFRDNYYGLYLTNYYSPYPNIINNLFLGAGKLKPYYTGQEKDPTIYVSGMVSYCGVYMRNVYCSIGDLNDPNNINRFEQLQNGIIAYNSRLNVHYCDMLNIGGGIKGPFNFEHGIIMSGTIGSVNYSTFDNCPKAISAAGVITAFKGAFIHIIGNKITNSDIYGITVGNSEGVQFEVNHNIIKVSDKSKMYFGIQLRNAVIADGDNSTGSYAKINHNDISTSKQYTDGIRILDCDGYTPGHIYENYISPHIDIPDAGRGIYLNNATYFQVDSNTVSGGYDGIMLEKSVFNLVRKNSVSSSKLSKKQTIDNFSGIWANESYNNQYCCNKIDYKKNALHFTGACERFDGIVTNQFEHYKVGLLYDADAITGPQNNMGNDFDSMNGSNTGTDAQHLGKKSVVNMSLYFCDGLQMPAKVVSASPNWFSEKEGLAFCIDNDGCKSSTWFGPSFIDTIITTRKLLSTDGPKTQWQNDEYLYDMLSRNPGVMANNALMANYYKAQNETELGALYNVRLLMSSPISTSSSITEMTGLEAKLQNFMQELQKLETQKANANPKEKEAIAQQIAALDNDVKKVMSLIALIQSSAADAEKSKWVNIAKQNANISSKILAAQLLQKVNDYVATYHLQENSLSAEQLSSLYAIATKCPRTGGSAVFTARGLYEYAQNIVVNWKTVEQCKETPFDTKVSKNNINATIYPNPVSNELHIDIPSVKDFTGEVVIYNLRGQIAFQQAIGVSNTIDVQGISQGMYIVKIVQNSQVLQTEKLTIIK